MSPQHLNWVFITLGLLTIVVSVSSLQCFQCQSTLPGSKCQTSVKEFAKKEKSKFAANCSDYAFPHNASCVIETKEVGGNLGLLIRECSDGKTFTFDTNRVHFQKMLYHDASKNTTICSFENGLVCLTVCNTDYCNAPQSTASFIQQISILSLILTTGVYTLLHSC